VAGLLFSGDLLFAGSIGRTDLPGGDHPTMLRSLAGKILPLDDSIVVLPGHGEQTTIGRERANNPYLQNLEDVGGLDRLDHRTGRDQPLESRG
jgi:glyoxylase-like metal-dependent hydrolase (beta-lactamase superfamily II)